MRGVDYRLKDQEVDETSDGIDLLIDADFSNTRAYTQALARVGRYDEPCGRFIREDLDPVNKERRNELFIKLGQLKK